MNQAIAFQVTHIYLSKVILTEINTLVTLATHYTDGFDIIEVDDSSIPSLGIINIRISHQLNNLKYHHDY